MKNVLIALLIAVAGLGGYLAYDWISVADKRANAPIVNIYSWKDADGLVHFSDKTPPSDAREIQKTRGQAYIAPPLIVRVKERAMEWFDKAKKGISKRSDRKSKKKAKP